MTARGDWERLFAVGVLSLSSVAACQTTSQASNVSGESPASASLPILVPSGSGSVARGAPSAGTGKPTLEPTAPDSDSDSNVAVRSLCAPGAGSARTWHISTWHSGSPNLVALSYTAIPATVDPKLAKPELCLVESQAGKLTKLATGPVQVGETECSNQAAAPSDPPSFELDLAPYVLATGSTALGVRLTCQNTFGAGEGGQSRLYLFEQQGARLAQVLDEEIGWFSHDRVASSHAEAKGVLVIQKREHEGHFDLVIHMNVVRESDDGAPSKATETRKLVWKTDRYVRVAR